MDDAGRVVSAHRSGMPPSLIARELGVPPSEVYGAILDWWRSDRTDLAASALRLWEDGLSTAEIADELGVSRDRAWKALRANGIRTGGRGHG